MVYISVIITHILQITIFFPYEGHITVNGIQEALIPFYSELIPKLPQAGFEPGTYDSLLLEFAVTLKPTQPPLPDEEIKICVVIVHFFATGKQLRRSEIFLLSLVKNDH